MPPIHPAIVHHPIALVERFVSKRRMTEICGGLVLRAKIEALLVWSIVSAAAQDRSARTGVFVSRN